LYTTVGSAVPSVRATSLADAPPVEAQLSVTNLSPFFTSVFVSFGGVASKRKLNGRAALVLPALSWHVPEMLAGSRSGPEYGAAVQVATPERESPPAKLMVTGFVYQSPLSGLRSAAAPDTSGGVESYLSWMLRLLVLPALSRHETVTEVDDVSGPP
jgi:hypothetical protein